MMFDYHESYLGKLRKLVGKQKLISISARAIIQDEQERILLVQRSDNGHWVMPAGSLELGESIYNCVKREVREETGLTVQHAYPIALYSDPRYSFVTAYGDPYQMFSVVFVVDSWSGELRVQTNETRDAGFFDLEALPELPELYAETLADLECYKQTGQFILK